MSMWTTMYLVYNIVITLSYERFMGVFFEKRRTPFTIMLCSYLIFYILTSIAFLLINIPIIALPIVILTSFIITLNYESTMAKRFVTVFFCFLFGMIIEISVGIFLTSMKFEPLKAGEGFNAEISAFIIAGLLIYTTASILRRFKNIKKNIKLSPLFWVSSIFIPASSIMMLVILAHFPQNTKLIISAIIFTINLLTCYLYDSLSAAYEEKIKSLFHTQEKEYYFIQCQLMQESIEKVKSIRHDIKIHLAALKEFSIKGKSEDIADYLDSLIDDIGKSEIYSDTGNIAFDSIINYKLNNAKSDDIKLNLKISIPPVLNIEMVDVVTILGNLFDNALDAVAKVNEKIIRLDIVFEKSGLYIKMENSFNGAVKYSNENFIEEKQIISSKSEDEHGYGLKNIRQSIEKYNGYMKITHSDNMFSVGVFLYISDN